MTEEMIDHTKLNLSYVKRAMDNCIGQEIPYAIEKAMCELSRAIQEFINPNLEASQPGVEVGRATDISLTKDMPFTINIGGGKRITLNKPPAP